MTNDVEIDAILLDVEKDISKSFNAVLGATIAVCIVFLFLSATFGNAVTQITGEENSSTGEYVPLWERYLQDYSTDGPHGYVLETGTYQILETANEWNSTHHFVEYELPLEEGGAAPNGLISLAVWRPDVEDGVKVPVIAEIGPTSKNHRFKHQPLKSWKLAWFDDHRSNLTSWLCICANFRVRNW